MARGTVCREFLSKLSVAPLRESTANVHALQEMAQTPGLMRSEMNTTIKLPSQIGGNNKASLGFLSNNQSNVLDQIDR